MGRKRRRGGSGSGSGGRRRGPEGSPGEWSIVRFADLERLPNAVANALRAMAQPHAVDDLVSFAWEWLSADADYKCELLMLCERWRTFYDAVVVDRRKDAQRGVFRG